MRGALVPEHVDFGANAKRVEIQTRFDGEARAWQNPSVVMRLVIVETHAVSMDVFAKTMAGPVQDVLCVASRFQHHPRCPIDLPPPQFAAGRRGLLDQLHRSVARAGNRGKRPADSGGWLGTGESNPRDVSKDR